ncbi:MAG: efflux RND transporter periplasmic adaptor subunit [Betaproteobacteria bacterium]|nr:efflux RND transporter periplasmic adaptor subunit [Betaproteobacteria bacterium]
MHTSRSHTPIILLAVAAFVLMGAASAQEQKRKPPAGPPPGTPVKAAPVKVGAVNNEVSAVGTLLGNESVMIRPEVAGRIAAINFNEGQVVARGALLVTLDSAEVKAQLAGSTADERLNKQRAERAEQLYKKNFISQQALDDAREAYKKATARRQEDEARAAKTEIHAPFNGIVGLRLVSAGAYLKAGEDIVRLDNIDTVKLDFRVPETYLGQMGKSQAIALRVDAYPAQQFTGQVYAIEPSVDEKTRTAMLRARVPNPGGKLKPGMFARVTLHLGTRANAILIPEQAVVPRGDKNFVFRVIAGKVQMVAVELGTRTPGEVEVIRGLGKDDVVVTDGQIKLQDGIPVMILPDKPLALKPQAKGGY